MKACQGDGQQVQDALLGAAHRAAPGRLARLGNRPGGLRARPGRPGRSGHRCGWDRVRGPPGCRLCPGDRRAFGRGRRCGRCAGHRVGAFRDAAAGDLTGWEVTAASAELQPDLRLTGAGTPPLPAGPAIDHLLRACSLPARVLACSRSGLEWQVRPVRWVRRLRPTPGRRVPRFAGDGNLAEGTFAAVGRHGRAQRAGAGAGWEG